MRNNANRSWPREVLEFPETKSGTRCGNSRHRAELSDHLVLTNMGANDGTICAALAARRADSDPAADLSVRRPALGHDPEKWAPVFGQDHDHKITTRHA